MIKETYITVVIDEVITHPKISTLEFEGKQKGRQVGNSTRQIDFAIQKLFEGYRVKVEDHYCHEGHRQADKLLFHKIMKRLDAEHNIGEAIVAGKFEIDVDKLEMEFI